MTPAQSAAAQDLIQQAFARDPELREWWAERLATLPVPADARERTWTKIAAALTEGVSAPQPAVGNSGSTGLAASFRGVTVTSPRQGATHSGALAAVGEGR